MRKDGSPQRGSQMLRLMQPSLHYLRTVSHRRHRKGRRDLVVPGSGVEAGEGLVGDIGLPIGVVPMVATLRVAVGEVHAMVLKRDRRSTGPVFVHITPRSAHGTTIIDPARVLIGRSYGYMRSSAKGDRGTDGRESCLLPAG